MIRTVLHTLRNQLLRGAIARPFRPIESPGNRIVLVRPDHFGDLLLLTPAIEYLQQHLPDHEITLMTGPWNEAVARHVAPEIEVLTWPFPGFDRNSGTRSPLDPYRDIARAAETVRDRSPRAILLLRDDHWWGAWMAREAGIPIRVGYNNSDVAPFLTHSMEIERANYARQNLEMVQRSISLLGGENASYDESHPSLTWPVHEAARSSIQEVLGEHGVSDRYVIIHPGTGAPVKTWPTRRWAALADQLTRRSNCQVLLTGSADERQICAEVDTWSGTSLLNLAGQTTLFQLAELFRGAALVLGVDSGPLHLAVATGTPSVHLYGPSDHVRYGPWGDPDHHRVIRAGMTCPACGDLSPERSPNCGCMAAIQSNEVAQVAIEMLHEY